MRNMSDNTDVELAEQNNVISDETIEEMLESMLQMSPEEISEFIYSYIVQTDVVVDAVNNMSANLTLQDSILISSLDRTRKGLEFACMWIDNYFSGQKKQAHEGKNEKITKSPESKKEGKRIVYGNHKQQDIEDSESEQL
jgi:hypothetical protein